MDSPVPHTVTVRGKDLPGAVMVMPMGLDAAIKKRVSGEFKSEKSGNSLTFGTVSGGLGGPGVSQASFQQKQSSQFSQMTSSSGGGGGMSAANNMSSSMMSSSQQKSFQQTSMSSASSFERSSFSSSSQQKKTNRVSGGFQDFSVHGEEIRQAKLKDQLHSAMSDLESEIGQEYKENVSSNVMKSPTPSKGPHQEAFSPTPPSKHEYFSPPPLEAVPKPEPVSIASPVPVSFSPAPQKQPTPVSAPAPFSMSPEPVRNQQEPVSVAAPFSMSPEPAALPAQQPEMVAAPFSMEPVVRNQMASASMQNGFSDFGQSVTDFGSSYKSESSFMSSQQQETSFMSSQKQESSFMSSQKQESSFMSSKQQENYSASKQESFSSSSTLNRALEVESAGGQLQESDSNSSLLQKIMTPASNDFDSSSLKRRDPRKMFTDSSFYSSKHHPTVADQVEMAHRLTSALFKEDNKNSKGQQMYLNRMKKSGEESDMEDYCMPKRDAVPNMKLVMNPEGKVHEWNDMDPSELPNAALLAGHAAPSLPSPEIINPMIEDLNSNTGRGETFVHRPNSFVSAYRRVFDSNRGVFGSKTSGNNIDNSGNKGSSEANNDNTKTNTTTSHTVKDNWVVKDTSKPGKSLLPTWGTLKRYQNNGNNKTKPIHAPKTVETPKPVNAFARDNTKSQGLKQDNKLLYTSPLERKSINKPANEVVKITTANAFVSPAPLKKVWTPNVSATPSGRSVTAATASSAASTSSASTTRLVFTPSSLRHTGTATPSTPATSNKFTSFKPTFSTCTPLAPICSLTSTITPRHEVLTPVESTVINNSKATNSVPSSATSNRSTTIPSTPSSILKKGSATSTEIQQSVDHNINSQMDDFIEKNFTPLPKVDVLDTSKKNDESVDPAKIDRACIHRKMDDFIASNYKPESYEKKPTASIIKKPSAQMPEQGDISYTAVVTPRLKRKVSIKATEKASEISKDKSNVDPAEKNQVTITPITPARHKRVMISTSNEYPKRFQSTPDISATQNITDKQIALSHFGSPASRRRMPLSTTNQNIVSFFENKHKTTVDAVPLGGGHMQRRSISANTRNNSRQSEIPKGASYIDFQADTSTDSTNTSKEWGINYVPTTSMVAKTKALFEGKENQGHLPIQKSRTFSSFPTDYTYGDGVAITPSPPKRSSSKKVTADYQVRSLNMNLDQCGTDYGSCHGLYSSQDIVSSSASTTLDRKENLPNVINIPPTSSNAGSLEKKSSNLTKEISENIDMKDVEVHEKTKEDNTGSRDGLPDSPALNRRPLRDFFR